jgi:hypothetical protein
MQREKDDFFRCGALCCQPRLTSEVLSELRRNKWVKERAKNKGNVTPLLSPLTDRPTLTSAVFVSTGAACLFDALETSTEARHEVSPTPAPSLKTWKSCESPPTPTLPDYNKGAKYLGFHTSGYLLLEIWSSPW